jgi:flagellin
MGLYVNTNNSALNARRNLNNTTRATAQSFQRLSSGLRINSAKDDAAGLAISERMTSQIRGINQAVRNAGDGVSLAQTAEGALQETTNILQRMRELSVQSANDTNKTSDRESIQQEMDQLTSELDRIAEKTTFNNQKILDGSFNGAKFHVGANSNETISVNVKDARAGSLGRMARVETASVSTETAGSNQGVGAGGFAADSLYIKSKDGAKIEIRATSAADDNLSTSDAQKASSAIAKAAAINDSTQFHGVTATATATIANLGTVDASTFAGADTLTINGEEITGINVQADDGDGTLVDAINAIAEKTGVTASIDEDQQLILRAEDGRNVEVTAGADVGLAAAVEGTTQTYRGGLTLQSDNNISFFTGALGADDADEAGNGAISLIGLTDAEQTVGFNADFAVNTIDVTTREGANRALDTLDQALKQVTGSRSSLGAVQNRMEATVRNLEVASENLQASRGRIQDADFAEETAKFFKNQIMQQAGVNILAQANQAPNIAMSLLG